MGFTADRIKTSFSVSVTPKTEVKAVAGKHNDLTVLHEDVRTTLGGSGVIVGDDDDLTINSGTGAGQWQDGVYTKLDSAASGSFIGVDIQTECVFIKHMGLLSDGTACSDADTLKLMSGADFAMSNDTDACISELHPGEAIVLVRPGNMMKINLVTGNSTNHVQVQYLFTCT